MVDVGALHIILVSRSGLQASKTQELLEQLEAKGSKVQVYACDVGVESQVQDMISRGAQDMPPIIEVIHSAMILKVGPP